jgi:cell wall-associated NlpC family hydrolase
VNPPNATPTAEEFVELALAQHGDAYVWGAGRDTHDADPHSFDCSGLVYWALSRIGVTFPSWSGGQLDACRADNSVMSVERAITIRGALLFAPRHVAISLGNGSTIEAAGGSARKVIIGVASANRFNIGAYVPGLSYAVRDDSDPSGSGSSIRA